MNRIILTKTVKNNKTYTVYALMDENGNYKMSTNLVSASSGSTETESSRDAVSNPDAPAPPEDDNSETTQDNNAETDGITNEEAGLE